MQTDPIVIVAAETVNVGHSLRYRQELRELARGVDMAIDNKEVEPTGPLGESNNYIHFVITICFHNVHVQYVMYPWEQSKSTLMHDN